MKNKVVFAVDEEGWQALYINNKKTIEGHEVCLEDAFNKVKDLGKFDFKKVYISDDYIAEQGGWFLPENLKDLPLEADEEGEENE